MITMIVMGTIPEALAAAANRGIPFMYPSTLPTGEVIGSCIDLYHQGVAQWFQVPSVAPFSPGTLVQYTISDDIAIREIFKRPDWRP